MMIVKVTRKQGFTPSQEENFLAKPQGQESQCPFRQPVRVKCD